MLIKSIELTNFRIFCGKRTVDFSTDEEKNVTVIMGDNGSGKTTFAQAFSWCLYGTTTFKKSDDLLSFPVRDELRVGKTALVEVRLTLIHNKREYRITRSQEYRKDTETKLHAETPVLSISYKAPDGQDEFIENESEKRDLINEIIPSSISSYFFFDGERVERMGNEIQEGRSKEFKLAVDNLLGLSAITEAIRHLKGSASMVIGSYNKDYNANSDAEFQRAEKEIQAANDRIAKLNEEIEGLEEERSQTLESRDKYKAELEKAKESRQWAQERSELEARIDSDGKKRSNEMGYLSKAFGSKAWQFFITPLLASAVAAIDGASVEFKEAPTGVTADTIRDIIERKTCLCGTHVDFNSKEWNELQSWLKIVPPEHLGAALSNFKRSASLLMDDDEAGSLLDTVEMHLGNVRTYDHSIMEAEKRIVRLNELLEGAKDMSGIERKYQAACKSLTELDDKIKEKNTALGMAQQTLRDAIAKRNSLTTNDETNKRVRRDRDYAEYIYEQFKQEHDRKESETRMDLEQEINDIFREFFNGSLQLELDEKYNVTVRNKDSESQAYDVETSEGQTVAVIFAFIAGVIRLASDSKRLEDEMLITESYPLVMDAPMSKLDKKRIAAICDVVPRIAEQTIIMIKDTDGELARDYLSNKIGVEYAVISIEPERRSEFEKVDA